MPPFAMDIVTSISDMKSHAAGLRAADRSVALVPTMGFLHQGHLSLIKAAGELADIVVVSIFVNPTQFAPNEDFSSYPRDLERDLALCREAGVDAVFHPPHEEMYPPNYSTFVTEEALSKTLCGISRPHHFRGVTTVVAKLFNIVRPKVAVFGQKDAQQAAILRKMVADLHFDVKIEVAPTVREKDGLAMSSRNTYLSTGQLEEAAIIPKALETARAMVEGGMRNADRVMAEVTHLLATKRRVRVIYVALVDRDTMEAMREVVPGRSLLAVAAWVDEVRLIDNILL